MMGREQLLFNCVSDEAKRQHAAEVNEFVYGGTPTVPEHDVSSEIGYFGGVQHLKEEDQQREEGEQQK